MSFETIRFFNRYGKIALTMALSATGAMTFAIIRFLVDYWGIDEEVFLQSPSLLLLCCLYGLGGGFSVCFVLWYLEKDFKGEFNIVDGLFSEDYPDFYRNSCYVGQVRNGQAMGKGKLFDAQSLRLVYSGSFVANHISYGTFYYKDGNSYTGAFKNDLRNGYGKFVWSRQTEWKGHYYEGAWIDDWRTGFGTYHWPNGDRYKGMWDKGNQSGWGVMRYSRKDKRKRYEGMWSDGKQEGYGVMYWRDGSEYVGQWAGDNMNGQGAMRYANGDYYEGEWVNDTHP